MKGVYVLIIKVKKDLLIDVGALGGIEFKKGNYAYVGSAQNNLKKRIQRHLSKDKKKRWHIDYLLLNPNTKIENIFYKEVGKEEECKIAHMLNSSEESITGFGSSDCGCQSHLFRLKRKDYFAKREFKKIKDIDIL